jgi:hypothetical protein
VRHRRIVAEHVQPRSQPSHAATDAPEHRHLTTSSSWIPQIENGMVVAVLRWGVRDGRS